MDLWDEFTKRRDEKDYGSKRLLMNTGDRHFTSLNMVGAGALELLPGRTITHTFSMLKRYIISVNMSFDTVATIYDVNSRTMMAMRFTREPLAQDWSKIHSRVKVWNNPNLELRVFGMLNGSLDMLKVPQSLHNKIDGKFMEIDLFGTDMRHLVFDLKTGVSYDLLMLNRLYRPGELINQVTKDEFDIKRTNVQIS